MAVPVISVIVPVYNVEKYLKKCIESILMQTFHNFELICVNDGTTDNSRSILEKYKQEDKRIIIIDKKNGGLSSARNEGLKYAKGEFISFVDSDDWITPDMLEKLYKNITFFNSDISMCAVNLFDELSQSIKNDSYFNFSIFPKDFDNKVFSFEDTKNFIMDIPVMAWNKLYRHDFLKQCNAKFPDGKIFEDGPFFFSIFFKTKRVSIVRDTLYYYRINREGSLTQKNGKNLFDIIVVVNLMFNELKNSNIFKDVKYEFFKRKADDIIYRYELIPASLKSLFSKKFKKSSCLLNENYFDFSIINKKYPVSYKNICRIKAKTSILAFYLYKFKKRLMYKIMQLLCTEENIYYLKFWSLKIRFKKRANICNIWYENDQIHIILFSKIKFNFKFEYSKIEQK